MAERRLSRIQRAIEEQKACAEYLLNVDHNHAGARLGLADWVAEEVFAMEEERIAADLYAAFIIEVHPLLKCYKFEDLPDQLRAGWLAVARRAMLLESKR